MSDYTDRARASRLARIARGAAQAAASAVQTAVAPERLPADRVGGVDPDMYATGWDGRVASAHGAAFAFIRAGEYGEDPLFKASWDSARAVMLRAPYWFLTKDPVTSIGAQARTLASLFPGGYDGELPIVLDLEDDRTFPIRGERRRRLHLDRSDADSFLAVLRDNLRGWDGRWINYSNWSWQTTYGQGVSHRVPLWLSNPPPYARAADRYAPALPEPWRTAAFHGLTSDLVPVTGAAFIQTSFAGDGRYYGTLEKGIDLDVWMGTPDQLNAFAYRRT